MNARHAIRRSPRWIARGFSLIEMMVTVLIFSLLATVVVTVLLVTTRQKISTANEVGSTEMARTAMDALSRDLRSAGFGIDNTASTPQQPIAYIDSIQILINCNAGPYPDTSVSKRGIPLAYNPAGSPKPFPLNGTSWTPSLRYTTGAETIRWTLDLDNNGVVNATDLTTADGADANRTLNPNDYELCREVYGDSTGGAAGNNGGARERIALIKKPGGSQPPLFRVYLKGDSNPWNWANGPVPASRLQEIVRVQVNIVATSQVKNFTGKYTDVTLTTTVSELRNAPNFSSVTYNVSGMVFNDANRNGTQDNGEAGIAGAMISAGGYLSVSTSSTGAYSFALPPGTYTLRQDPPDNYGTLMKPDSIVATVGPSRTCNFADSLRLGGWVTMTVYNDVDKNKSYGGPDQPMLDRSVMLAGSSTPNNTDANGVVVIFVPVGSYSIAPALPDSFTFSTPSPITGTMTNGGTRTCSVGMYIYDSGSVSGTVYNDANGNLTLDPGEKGISDAYVSCVLPDSTLIYTYTAQQGKYSLRLPVNDPPRTTPYTITCTPPAGAPIGTKLTISSVYLTSGAKLTGMDFSLGRFTATVTDLDRPLTDIALGDFVENDWRGQPSKYARGDLDIVSGSDRSSTSAVEQWFNQYDNPNPFQKNPDISRTVTQSVNVVALDTLNAGTGGVTRPDVIAGTQYTSGGNIKIMHIQEMTGNEGTLPNSPAQSLLTGDNGDVSSIVTIPSTTAGGSPDILVGTQSPAAGKGTIELWRSATHVSPLYARIQTLPTTGGLPGGTLGAVTGMVAGPINSNVAGNEIAVVTRTGYYTGEVRVLKYVSGAWTYDWGVTLTNDAPTCVALADIDADGKKDLIVGTQDSHSSGKLLYYHNKGGNPVNFDPAVSRTATGIVTALGVADYGGDGIDDLVVGWRGSDTNFVGGVELWFTSVKTLPSSGSDAASGNVTNWVTSIAIGNINYGLWPATPGSNPLVDIVGTTRTSATKGQFFTLIR